MKNLLAKDDYVPTHGEIIHNSFNCSKYPDKNPHNRLTVFEFFARFLPGYKKTFITTIPIIKFQPIHPNVTINVIGENAHPHAVVGLACKEARKQGVSEEEISKYKREVSSVSETQLLPVTATWFNLR